jgi:Ca2+-transporting ATPase
VLTDDNFASIEAAVQEGRRVYDNLIKSLAFVLPTNLGLAFILTAAILFFPYDVLSKELLLPMQPTQLLWINLVATVALALPLAFEASERNIMTCPPRPPGTKILDAFMIQRTIIAALLMTIGSVGLFLFEYHILGAGEPPAKALAKAQTMAVTTVIMFQIFYMQTCRSLKHSVFTIGLLSNKAVLIGVFAIMLLQAAFIYLPLMHNIFDTHPLGFKDLALSAVVGVIIFPAVSFEKWLRLRFFRESPGATQP